MAEDIPKQIEQAGLVDWYSSLSSQDKVRARRYLDGIDTSSDQALILDLMQRAVNDENYKFAVTAGSWFGGKPVDGITLFNLNELLIEGLFGADRYEEAKDVCYRTIEIFPIVREKYDLDIKGKYRFRSRLIDIVVGIDANYEEAYNLLDRYVEMGLIDEDERDLRKQSLKVHRMQRSFDNIFNLKSKN